MVFNPITLVKAAMQMPSVSARIIRLVGLAGAFCVYAGGAAVAAVGVGIAVVNGFSPFSLQQAGMCAILGLGVAGSGAVLQWGTGVFAWLAGRNEPKTTPRLAVR